MAAVTNDASPNVLCERAVYDAYGWRNGIQSGSNMGNSSPAGVQPTERGFTGHEHIEELNRVHMNGRVFDPILGRAMQRDPTILVG